MMIAKREKISFGSLKREKKSPNKLEDSTAINCQRWNAHFVNITISSLGIWHTVPTVHTLATQ